ncbi:hypothetical protein QBC41DRAFT_324841 [Cercophora samala]|uniref:NADH dehydrogenase subunit 3 n=1 Tax=Cercophora samala TaxID=330535 RepID=A0AA39ZAJ5_9PEZI|nr:hypothetical protein QBC41DRAFT_324841 [Cercophora samala]
MCGGELWMCWLMPWMLLWLLLKLMGLGNEAMGEKRDRNTVLLEGKVIGIVVDVECLLDFFFVFFVFTFSCLCYSRTFSRAWGIPTLIFNFLIRWWVWGCYLRGLIPRF